MHQAPGETRTVSRTRTRTRNSLPVPGQDRATFTDERRRVKTRKRVKDPDRVGQTRRRETLAQGRTRVAEPWHSDSAQAKKPALQRAGENWRVAT